MGQYVESLEARLAAARIGQAVLEREYQTFMDALEPWSIDNGIDIVGAPAMEHGENNLHTVVLKVPNRTDLQELTDKFNGESNLTMVKVRFVQE